MTTDHLLILYKRTSQSYGRDEVREGEWESWKNVLGSFAYSNVDEALKRWQQCTDVEDYTQRPMGARMPQPAEIALSIKRFDAVARPDKKFKSCDKCWSGWMPVDPVPEDGKKYIGRVRRCECWLAWREWRKSA